MGAEVEELEAAAGGDRVTNVTLCGEPLEPGGEQREDVDLHRAQDSAPGSSPGASTSVPPRNSRSISMCRAATSTWRTASLTIGTSSSPPLERVTWRTSQEGSSSSAATVPTIWLSVLWTSQPW